MASGFTSPPPLIRSRFVVRAGQPGFTEFLCKEVCQISCPIFTFSFRTRQTKDARGRSTWTAAGRGGHSGRDYLVDDFELMKFKCFIVNDDFGSLPFAWKWSQDVVGKFFILLAKDCLQTRSPTTVVSISTLTQLTHTHTHTKNECVILIGLAKTSQTCGRCKESPVMKCGDVSARD